MCLNNKPSCIRVNHDELHSLLQLKKILSSIPETMLNVECLMNDVDVSSKMTREIFEEKSKHILERVKLPLQKVCPYFFCKTCNTLANALITWTLAANKAQVAERTKINNFL